MSRDRFASVDGYRIYHERGVLRLEGGRPWIVMGEGG
jgi:hypothetical protein